MSVLKMKRWKNVLEKQIRMQPKTNPILIWCKSVRSSSRASAVMLVYTRCPAGNASIADRAALRENDPYGA